MNKKIIAPICTAVAMLGLAVGSTFALFTDKGSADINVLAGQVKIDYSMTLDVAESRYLDLPPYDAVAAAEGSDFDAIFENGGTAKVVPTENSINLTLDRLAPMDMIALTAKAKNKSDINIRHRYSIVLDGELVPALQVVVDGTDYSTADTHLEFTSCWSSVATPDVEQLCQKDIRVYFPYGGDEQNFYQGKECDIKVSVEAIQGNAHVEDPEDEDIEIPEYEEIHGEKPSTEEKFTYMFNSNGTVSTKTSGKSVDPDADELILNVENTGTPVVDVPTGKNFLALDVEELGLKTDNDVAVEVGVKIGSGKEDVEVYHDGTLIDSTYDTENGLVNFETKSFSPFDILWTNPKDSSFGFFDSYLVDEGLETEHWVHEISNAEEFRNIMDSTVHSGKTGQFDYPGANDKNTVYLIKNSINFGGEIYSAAQVEEVKAAPFTGILRGESINGERVVLSNVHLTQILNSGMSDHAAMWGLFDGVLNAKFESFTISDFSFDNKDGKDCGFLAAGQCDQNLKSKNPDYDPNAYLIINDVIVTNDCYIDGNANCGAFVGICRSLDNIELVNCINYADVQGTAKNIGGFLGDASYDEGQSSGWINYPNHSIMVENCINNGHITSGGYSSSLIGYSLHSGTISNYTNNGIVEVVGTGGADVGVATGRSTTNPMVTYSNVVQNGFIKYTGNMPLQKHENKISSMQVMFNNGEGLVSGFDGVSAPTQEYKNTTFILGDAEMLSLSFDSNGTLVVGENSLTNIAKIDVALLIGRHSGDPQTGIVLNSSSTANYQVYFEEITSTSGTTAELSSKGLKKVNQIGYFAPEGVTPVFPTESWGRIAKYVEQFHLDSSLYGTEGYTDGDVGYGINEKGGYVLVKDSTATGFTVITPLHEDPHFVIRAYDDSGKLVAFGDLYSGRIVGEHIPEDIHVTAGIDKYVYLGK